MFHDISSAMLARMQFLEELDKNEMAGNGVADKFQRLRQIPPETGKFIGLVAATVPEGQFIEIGTSAGYSTLWLAIACQCLKTKITTFELNPKKIAMAQETFKLSKVEEYVELISGNVLDHLPNYAGVSFCFLDTEKELYADCYNLVIPNMVSGGILLADNVISHKADLQSRTRLNVKANN